METSPNFRKLETASAYLLLAATILALFISNSPWQNYYFNFFHTTVTGQLGTFKFHSDLTFFINEVLMSIFFLIVALEIKYEMLAGNLNSLAKSLLPVIAAIGGMLVPGLIYAGFNYHDAQLLHGWAIPTATDIAFALGVLALLGPKVPAPLKAFLMALAILDDLAAIIIIALFYTGNLSLLFFGCALVCLGLLIILNICHVAKTWLYILIGIILWFFLLKSGIQPTLAGVALAFAIPLRDKKDSLHSPLQNLKQSLHPWVAFGIIPLFAFANAGVSLTTLSTTTLHLSIILGIIGGLFIGKQLGIFGACWLAIKLRIAELPEMTTWPELYGAAILGGIGFTISLFIGTLAFGELGSHYLDSVRIGVLCGSLLSAVVGYALILFTHRQKQKIM